MKLKKGKTKGFTLIEMMVAVSIFVIVAFIVTTVLLTLSASFKKSQKIRLLMDNMNFSVQSIALGLREGAPVIAGDCSGDGCAFVPVDKWVSGSSDKVCYKKLDREDGSNTSSIFSCPVLGGNCGTCDISSGQDILSKSIDIKKAWFEIFPSPMGGKRRAIKIVVAGVINGRPSERTDFAIQTAVTQRTGG
ncbi:MAG: type II secretion system protein [Candidatus Paceibacterota bacterium]|jgi:prepilin-type N-terminal cleavage/methylation domain-containing protein